MFIMQTRLPKERIAIFKPPFTITEADCFGPVTIKQYKQPRKSKNNQIRRNWFLFTHLTTKPVRLDLSRNITTNSFLTTLRQFIAQRGEPDIIWYDNGSNLVDVEKELKQALH